MFTVITEITDFDPRTGIEDLIFCVENRLDPDGFKRGVHSMNFVDYEEEYAYAVELHEKYKTEDILNN